MRSEISALVRVHDLEHAFGRRLRIAGVSFEDRQDLLGHRSGRITTHYSAAELGNLFSASNLVVGEGSRKTPAENPTSVSIRLGLPKPENGPQAELSHLIFIRSRIFRRSGFQPRFRSIHERINIKWDSSAVNVFFGYLKRWNGCMESAPEDLPIQAGERYLCIS
jgi:hypothetical protein